MKSWNFPCSNFSQMTKNSYGTLDKLLVMKQYQHSKDCIFVLGSIIKKNYRKTKAKTVSKCRAKWILSGDISTEWKTLNSCISAQPSRQLLVRPASSPCRADGLVPVMTRNTAEDSFIWQLFLGFSWQRKITFSKLSDSPVTYIQHHISVVFNVPTTLF